MADDASFLTRTQIDDYEIEFKGTGNGVLGITGTDFSTGETFVTSYKPDLACNWGKVKKFFGEGVEVVRETKEGKPVLIVDLDNGWTFTLEAQTITDTEKLAQIPLLKKEIYELKKLLSSSSSLNLQNTPSRPLDLVNGWVPYGGQYKTPSFCIRNGVCFVEGLADKGGWGHIANLPEGIRPEKRLIFSCNHHDASMRIDVHEDGKITYVTGATKHAWISLSGIQFLVKE